MVHDTSAAALELALPSAIDLWPLVATVPTGPIPPAAPPALEPYVAPSPASGPVSGWQLRANQVFTDHPDARAAPARFARWQATFSQVYHLGPVSVFASLQQRLSDTGAAPHLAAATWPAHVPSGRLAVLASELAAARALLRGQAGGGWAVWDANRRRDTFRVAPYRRPALLADDETTQLWIAPDSCPALHVVGAGPRPVSGWQFDLADQQHPTWVRFVDGGSEPVGELFGRRLLDLAPGARNVTLEVRPLTLVYATPIVRLRQAVEDATEAGVGVTLSPAVALAPE